MKPLSFPEQSCVFAENQPEYIPLPAFVDPSPKGEVIFLMGLSFKERVKLLFTGKLWCCLLMFRNPKTGKLNDLTPSFFSVNKSDVLTKIKQ